MGRRFDDDEPEDLGSDLPDDREVYILKEEFETKRITLTIVRDRIPKVIQGEDGPEHVEGEYEWDVKWTIKENGRQMTTPIEDEDRVRNVLLTMYEGMIDWEATKEDAADRRTMAMESGFRY